MRRHPALVPLSDDHHHELAQARRLRLAADGSREERLAAGAAYAAVFFTDTVEHFRREEETVFPLYAAHARADDPLLARVLREHRELQGLARAVRAGVAAEDVPPETLRTLGAHLHDHVRFEERELFEAVERIVPAAALDALASA